MAEGTTALEDELDLKQHTHDLFQNLKEHCGSALAAAVGRLRDSKKMHQSVWRPAELTKGNKVQVCWLQERGLRCACQTLQTCTRIEEKGCQPGPKAGGLCP